MTFWISVIFIETFLEQSVWICKWVSWWCHPITIFDILGSQKLWKSHISATESKTCLISTLNKCRIMFALKYFDMGACFYMFEQKKVKMFKISYTKHMENCEAMRSSAHPLAYSYWLFTKCFFENYENSKISYLPYLLSDLHQIFTVSVQNGLVCWTTLNLDWISPLKGAV